jgi:hypothetical protein
MDAVFMDSKLEYNFPRLLHIYIRKRESNRMLRHFC